MPDLLPPAPTTSDPALLVRAVEAVPTGLLVYDGPDHVVVVANRTARAFFGDRPDILGRPLRSMFPESAGQNLVELVDSAYRTGEPFSAVEWGVVVAGHPDGDDRVVTFQLVPLIADDGTVTGVACPFTDVTALVRQRRSLEHRADELRERYEAVQDTVLALQRNLLPAGLPVLPGRRISAYYLVAAAEQAAGGDWFEAVPLDGTLAAVVGDVVGHGATASAVMAQLRAVLAEFLLDGDALDTVLARLDGFAGRTPGARGATVCVALVDPDGAVRYVCAGHPPPLVVGPDGATRYLPAPGGGPLGVAAPGPTVGTAQLAPGEMLVCYSDGLVERPGRELTDGMGLLAEVTSAAVLSVMDGATVPSAPQVDRITELTVDRMTRQGYHDDVTVLTVHHLGTTPADLVVAMPAEPRRLSGLRRDLEAWLVEVGAGDADIASIEIAVLEAVTNSVEHAYPEGGGTVHVEAHLDGTGRVCVTIADTGTWRPPPADPGRRGRGLMMMRGCMDTVEIEQAEGGTTLLLDRKLRRDPVVSPAVVAAVSGTPARPATLTVQVTASDEPVIALSGPLDLSTAEDLRRELWSASRGGALPLVVDLDGATHLASAGIQVLYDFAEDMSADGRALRFVVPPGSPARQALALSDLPRVVAVSDS